MSADPDAISDIFPSDGVVDLQRLLDPGIDSLDIQDDLRVAGDILEIFEIRSSVSDDAYLLILITIDAGGFDIQFLIEDISSD